MKVFHRKLGAIPTLVCLLLAFLTRVNSASAQPYAIDWYTVDGGGAIGTTGGAYTLSGTIGQPDPGVISGGTFSVAGGFWPGVSVVNLGPTPALSLRLGVAGTFIVSWPNPSTG